MDYSLVKDLFGYNGSSEFLAIAAGASAYALKLLVQFIFGLRSSRESSIKLLLENYEQAKGDFYLVEQVFAERYRINIPYRGIQLFRRSDFASDLFICYRLGYKHLRFCRDYRSVELAKSNGRLMFETIAAWCGYIGFGLIGFLMLFTIPEVYESGDKNIIAWSASGGALLIVAVFMLIHTFTIKAAKELAEKFA
jgi:hypothetical protein